MTPMTSGTPGPPRPTPTAGQRPVRRRARGGDPVRRAVLLAMALLLAVSADLGVSGCVSLPRTGPVQSRSVADTADGEALVDYTPAGPRRRQHTALAGRPLARRDDRDAR